MQIASPQKSEQTAGRAHPDLFTPVPPGDNSFQTTSLTWFLIHRIPKVVIPKCMSRTPPSSWPHTFIGLQAEST